MATFSIGHVSPYAENQGVPTELVQVEAADADSPVTRVISTGDDASYDMAIDEVGRVKRRGVIPTPAVVALGIAGSGATVNPA